MKRIFYQVLGITKLLVLVISFLAGGLFVAYCAETGKIELKMKGDETNESNKI